MNVVLALPFIIAGSWLGIKGVTEVSLKVAETHRAEKVVTTGVYSMVRRGPVSRRGLPALVGVVLPASDTSCRATLLPLVVEGGTGAGPGVWW